MPFTAGKNPTEGGNFIKTKELPPLQSSGLFLVQVASAMYYKGENKDGKTYEQCRLDCAVMYNGEPVRSCSFSFFLPSHDMEALCYFLNLRDVNGLLSLPDPDHRHGTSAAGKEYDMYTFNCLQNQLINVCLEYKGMNVSQSGTQYPIFRLVGFCDVNGCTAVEAYQNKPCETLKSFIAEANAARAQRQAAPAAPAQPAPAPAPAYGYQQASAPAPVPNDDIPF